MPAVLREIQITKYVAGCDDCELFLGSTTQQSGNFLSSLITRHDQYCHGPEPVPHVIQHWNQNMAGSYVVDCRCGKTTTVGSLGDWRCPLDRTIIDT